MDQIIRKKPTIYDLSLLSGHSPSTVSAVINGTWRKRRIKEATAKAILDLARTASIHRQSTGARFATLPLGPCRPDGACA